MDSGHLGDGVPALALAGLTFRYPGQAEALLDISEFSCDRAEQVLLAGRSGMGKSTLLNLILGLLEPSSGSVEIAGQNIHSLRGSSRDRFRGSHIGIIFQTFHLLQGFTAVENVMIAMAFSDIPASEHKPRALGLLDRLDLPRPDAFPENLSIGQQQRVAVARALACEPDLVLADEPTASLDPENAAGAMDLIQEVCREHNAALLCVSHDPGLVSRFGRSVDLAGLNSALPAQSSK